MKRLSLLLLLLMMSSVCHANLTQLKSDFSPLNGTIIMAIENEFLVDLDASSGVKPGDILTIVTPGEALIHPESKDIIGHLEVASGFLVVTRTKTGYSYAKVLPGSPMPVKGQKLVRYEKVPAYVEATVPAAEKDKIVNALPQLDWLSAADHSKALLTFSMTDNQYAATSADGTLINSYKNFDSNTKQSFAAQQADPFTLSTTVQEKRTPLNQAVSGLFGTTGNFDDKGLESIYATNVRSGTTPLWISEGFVGNGTAIAAADFNGDGLNEIAVAAGSHLYIAQVVKREMTQLASIDFPAGTQILALDQLDSNQDGQAELYLSIAQQYHFNSQVVEYKDGKYQVTMRDLPWIFRAIHQAKDTPVLLGRQLGSPDAPFKNPVFQLERDGSEIKIVKQLDIPDTTPLFSYTPLSSDKVQQHLSAYISMQDTLTLADQHGEILWKSSRNVGGSESYFSPVKVLRDEMEFPFYIQPRLIQLQSGELLSIENAGWRVFQKFRDFSSGRITAFKLAQSALEPVWSTPELGDYVADFNLADADNDGRQELVALVRLKNKPLFDKERCHIAIYTDESLAQ